MRLALAFALILGIAACQRPATQEDRRAREEKTDEQMRQAGRAAYDAAQKAEQAARELGRQVERAGKSAQQGWDEAKREHEANKDKPRQ